MKLFQKTEQKQIHEEIKKLSEELEKINSIFLQNIPAKETEYSAKIRENKTKALDSKISSLKRKWDIQDATNKTQIAFFAALLALISLGYNVTKKNTTTTIKPVIKIIVVPNEGENV